VIVGFVRGLRQPEYVHVLLNSLPVYAYAGGKIRHRKVRNEPAPPIKSQED